MNPMRPNISNFQNPARTQFILNAQIVLFYQGRRIERLRLYSAPAARVQVRAIASRKICPAGVPPGRNSRKWHGESRGKYRSSTVREGYLIRRFVCEAQSPAPIYQ